MKVLSIVQPAYLPWLGYFERLHLSSEHVVLDHVEIDLNSKTKFANRNRIRTAEGWCWLTVPLATKHRRGSLHLDHLAIAEDPRWRRKHAAAIRANYAKAAHFNDHWPFFENLFARDWTRLVDLCGAATGYLARALGVTTPTLRSSEMDVAGSKDDLILNICKARAADVYLSGPFGRDYLDLDAFAAAGIEVRFHDYLHPTYRQAFDGFEPYMSVVDLLFNHGPASLDLLSTATVPGSHAHAASH
ncbi:MAG: WbqC family protein [Hyphomicrobiales bacterium]|nr:WbqC family protein [Hyphomicrobiales bacterium]